MRTFTVRPYRSGDEAAILELFNRTFGEDDPNFVERTPEEWRHRYVDAPEGWQILVAEDPGGNVIANYSALVVGCSVRGERRVASQPVDTVVDRAWRGSLRKESVFVSIGLEFQERYCKTGADFYNEYMYGLPNEKAFGVGTRILKYRPVHCPMPVQVGELDAGWLAELGRAAGSVEVEEPSWDAALPDLEALFLRHLDEVPLGTWRDARYLAWRYRDWPGVDYRVLVARRGGEPVAAAVFRLGWLGHPVGPVVDWLGPGGDRESVAALLERVGAITAEAGGSRVETWVTPCMAHHATLGSLGVAERPSPFNLCIMVFSRDFDLEWARARWVLTMGDSDIY